MRANRDPYPFHRDPRQHVRCCTRRAPRLTLCQRIARWLFN